MSSSPPSQIQGKVYLESHRGRSGGLRKQVIQRQKRGPLSLRERERPGGGAWGKVWLWEKAWACSTERAAM